MVVPSNVPFDPNTMRGSLILAPAERADLIVDFAGFAGRKVILYTDAPAPFPMGDEDNDFKPASNSGRIPGRNLRFDVVPARLAPIRRSESQKTDLTPGNDPLPVRSVAYKIPSELKVRQHTLSEDFDDRRPPDQRLGTNQSNGRSSA